MLIEKENSCLLLIDVQEKLTPHVCEYEQLVDKCLWLMKLAKAQNVPIITSEQYPKGLGETVSVLKEHIDTSSFVSKVHFSSCQAPNFTKIWDAHSKKQAIICGIETHVCVLQTAIELAALGVQVFVVVDAVSSRGAIDKKYALKRMRQYGIELVTSEMVFFEWLRVSGTEEFKKMSNDFLKG